MRYDNIQPNLCNGQNNLCFDELINILIFVIVSYYKVQTFLIQIF